MGEEKYLVRNLSAINRKSLLFLGCFLWIYCLRFVSKIFPLGKVESSTKEDEKSITRNRKS